MPSPEFTERFFTAKDGVRLFSRDYPAAGNADLKPVVCLHGLTRNSRDFEVVAPWIASLGRRVIAIDIRGRGRSGHSPDPMHYVPRVYVRDVAAQLRDLGIRRAVFIGTSMGGIITMLLAARHSRMVASAVLNDVGPEVAPAGLARISAYAGVPVEIGNWQDALDYVARINAAAFPSMDAAMAEKFAKRVFRIDDEGRPRLDYDPGIAIPLKAGKAAAPKWLAWALFRWLARRPLLLVRGENSDILDAATAAKMRRVARRMAFAEIARVGHAPLLEESDSRDAIARWLQTVS